MATERHKYFSDIQGVVDGQIASLGPRVEGYVADHIVDRELNRRGDALVQGMDLLSDAEAALAKLEKNPDFKTFDKDGKVLTESYSEKKTSEIKKGREVIQKLMQAMVKAYDSGDLKDLNQLLQAAKGKDKKEDGAGDSKEAT